MSISVVVSMTDTEPRKAIMGGPQSPWKVWYFIYSNYCPICGRTDEWRERRYGPKPDKWEDRHQFSEVYDYCDAL